MRVVCDANVLISALISSRGAPAQIIEAWEEGAFEMVVCPNLLGELKDVFTRSKLKERVDSKAASEYVGTLKGGGLLLPDPVIERQVTPDLKDEYLFALAVAGKADCLVSGDRHLTDLENLKPPILTPRQFVDRYL
ncbi:MAG: putative toxin-antitoxin system toxin component, PIN family [Thermoleophilales bacterium]|nr:putative toxin-antitoxin system toxin component, PIN family [Thermoleophilales bacterium]